MARFEIADIECATLGEAPAGVDTFFELGMMYSVGRSVPIDFVTAHKWFNLAAMGGNADASRLRREIADQMSEIGDRAGPARRARVAESELIALPHATSCEMATLAQDGRRRRPGRFRPRGWALGLAD